MCWTLSVYAPVQFISITYSGYKESSIRSTFYCVCSRQSQLHTSESNFVAFSISQFRFIFWKNICSVIFSVIVIRDFELRKIRDWWWRVSQTIKHLWCNCLDFPRFFVIIVKEQCTCVYMYFIIKCHWGFKNSLKSFSKYWSHINDVNEHSDWIEREWMINS